MNFSFKRQKVMEKVLVALLPALLGAIYFFGWRTLLVVAWAGLWGLASEHLMASRRGDPATESVLVTAVLFALSLPPAIPLWVVAVGMVFAIVFGKEVFGGFGRNVFNPAIVGRAFVYISFPVELTGSFVPAWPGPAGGLGKWGPPSVIEGVEAITAATPMWFRRNFQFAEGFTYWQQLRQLFFGSVGGVFEGGDGVERVLAAGSMGEVSALLLIVGGLYLLISRTANWRLVAGSLGGATAAVVCFRHLLGADAVPPLLWSLSSGGLLYACFFMVTDPVSAPRKKPNQWIYAGFIGTMIILFRWQSIFIGGVGFAILLGNGLAPTLDLLNPGRKNRKK